ncbi:MAG: LacI family DNA-binding transcriptional regulator [Planctomycetota bacterium]
MTDSARKHASDRSGGTRKGSPGSEASRAHAPSIKDVAEKAGVSIATVSRTLNSPGIVADATAKRVQDAVAQLGYRPNLFAKGLVTQQSRMIGISLPALHGEFYSDLMRAADARAAELGYHLLVSSDSGGFTGLAPGGPAGMIDGLVMMITERSHIDLLRKSASLGLPITVLGSADALDDLRLDSVWFDNSVGTRDAVEHLLESTRPQDVIYVGGAEGNLDSHERREVFVRTMRDHGHTLSAEQVVNLDFSFEAGQAWASQQLAAGKLRGAAILAGNDDLAVGIVDAALDAGLEIPNDLRVVGHDDSRLCRLIRPTLSSVHVPLAEVGRVAIELMTERLRVILQQKDASGTKPGKPTRVRLGTALIQRHTSSIDD